MATEPLNSPHRDVVKKLIKDITRQCGGTVMPTVAGSIVVSHAILALSDELGAHIDRLTEAIEGRSDG